MQIKPLGDSALLIDFADETDDADALLHRALAAAEALESAKVDGVIEVTSAYRNVAAFVAPDMADDVEEKIRAALSTRPNESKPDARLIEIPVCYDADFALDLERVAAHTKLAREEVIALHVSAEYTVACIGFMPGFPYLAGLPPQLATPRLEEPRVRIPAGSVATANLQAGVYPLESPGGWNVLGRTPLRLFDPGAEPPSLLRAGDHVRFRAITRAEFDAHRG